jgi:hypothetical protein
VAIKVLQGIPFFKDTKFVFILHTLVKVAAPASHLCPQFADQGDTDRLRQRLALRFSARTFMRMMARITQIVFA